MNVSICADKENVKKNNTINYTVSVSENENNSDVVLEIIPSAEIFPESCLEFPEHQLNENGILEIEIPNADSDFEVHFNATAIKSFEQNTTAVIATSDNNGSINEAYAQITLQGHYTPVIPVICTLIFIAVSALLEKRFI